MACAGAFNPTALHCASGADTGDDCLWDRQVAAVRSWRTPLRLPFAPSNGITSYPAYGYGGEAQPDGMTVWTTGPEAPRFPLPAPSRQGRILYFGDGALSYFIARDPAFNPLGFDPCPAWSPCSPWRIWTPSSSRR